MPRTRSDFRAHRPASDAGASRRVAPLDAVARAEGADEIVGPAADLLIGELGFGGFALVLLFRERASLAAAIPVARGALAGAGEAYVAQGLAAEDPIAARAVREDAPFAWASLLESAAGLAVARAFRSHGVVSGGAIPLASPGAGRRAMLWLCGAPAAEGTAFEPVFSAGAPLARLVGLAMCQTWAVRAEGSPGRRLSPSEREALSGLARGLRTADIAAEAGKSEHTVRNQIVGAQARLGARTPTEAVAIAIRLGLLL